MELQEVIDHVRNEHKSDLAKQIAEKLVLLGADNIKYVKEGKYSFNYGMNVGQSKALSWVLEQLKDNEREVRKCFAKLQTCKRCIKQVRNQKENTMTEKDLETICQHYGIRKQIKKLSEEVFELQEAVIDADQEWHFSTDNPLVEIERPIIQHIAKNQANIAEELADVMVLWEQIRLHYDVPIQVVRGIMMEKIERQLKRIENEKGR